MDRDQEALVLLSIFHFIMGGVVILCASLAVIGVIVGIGVLSLPDNLPAPEDTSGFNSLLIHYIAYPCIAFGIPPVLAGLWITIGSALVVIVGFPLGVCFVEAGKSLLRRRRRVSCMVLAGVSCAIFPFGTILGVITLVILRRPSLRESFARGPGALQTAS